MGALIDCLVSTLPYKHYLAHVTTSALVRSECFPPRTKYTGKWYFPWIAIARSCIQKATGYNEENIMPAETPQRQRVRGGRVGWVDGAGWMGVPGSTQKHKQIVQRLSLG